MNDFDDLPISSIWESLKAQIREELVVLHPYFISGVIGFLLGLLACSH